MRCCPAPPLRALRQAALLQGPACLSMPPSVVVVLPAQRCVHLRNVSRGLATGKAKWERYYSVAELASHRC